MKKSLISAAQAFVFAALVVLLMDPSAILAAGSVTQLKIAVIAALRPAIAAGIAAILPRLVAARDRAFRSQ